MAKKKKILTEIQKSKASNRVKKFIGQSNGLLKMIEEDRDCEDILIQIAAISSAMKSLGQEILIDHMKNAIAEDKSANYDSVDEYMKLYKHYM